MTQTGIMGWIGFPPEVKINKDTDLEKRLAERAKYEKAWKLGEYRVVAPGENAATHFLSTARPKPGSQVIDFGTGTGRGAVMIALLGSCKVHMLDFADNCLDDYVREALTTQAHALSFKLHDLNRPVPQTAEYGYCTDVMEHIPPEYVDRVLKNILLAAQHVYFQISCEDDVMGALVGEPLHLSVHPYAWWNQKLQDLGCVVHFSQDFGSHCIFYVTAWQKGDDVVAIGELNISHDKVRENVRENIQAGWQQVIPHSTNDLEVMILGGGPSLSEHIDTIKQLRKDEVKLITLNGTYNWAIDNGMSPSALVMVDAREFNARFSKPVHPECRYLIASQCHPKVLEGLPPEYTYLWHTSTDGIRDILQENYEVWFSVPGGSTVMLRAIPLLRMLGYKKFHLFGFDSCIYEKQHHAYEQKENDTDVVIDTIVGGRVFKCHAWMVSQAQEFMDLIKFLGDEIELEVYGDGLISHILRTGAELSEE